MRIRFKHSEIVTDGELAESFRRLFDLTVGDFIQVAAKRLVNGIYLGFKDDPKSELPVIFVSDSLYGPVRMPLEDIFWIEVVSKTEPVR